MAVRQKYKKLRRRQVRPPSHISNNNVTLLGIDESCRDFIIVREYSHRSLSNVALVLLQGDGTFEVNAGEVVSNV